jgi:ferric iron reductase protein FhuF
MTGTFIALPIVDVPSGTRPRLRCNKKKCCKKYKKPGKKRCKDCPDRKK